MVTRLRRIREILLYSVYNMFILWKKQQKFLRHTKCMILAFEYRNLADKIKNSVFAKCFDPLKV